MMPESRSSGDRQSQPIGWNRLLPERAGKRLESALSDQQVAESCETPMLGFGWAAEGSLESLAEFIQFRIEIPRRRTKDG